MAEKALIDVTARHPNYNDSCYNWDFYMDSYIGGTAYVKPISYIEYDTDTETFPDSYLFPSELETQSQYWSKFRRRHRRSVYENFCVNPVNDLTKYLFSQKNPIERAYIGEDQQRNYYNYIDNIDLRGTDINTFMTRLSRLTAIFGISHVLVDKKPVPQNITTIEQQRRAGNRAYCRIIDPRSLVNWSKDENGEYNWIVIKSEHYEDKDFRTTRVPVTDYWLWARDEIYHLDKGGVVIEKFPNSLGIVPLVSVTFLDMDENGEPESFLSNIAPLNREYYNVYSLYQEELYKLAFAALLKKRPDGQWPTDDELNSATNSSIISPEAVMEYYDIPPQYLVFPTGALEEKRKNMERIKESIQSITSLDNIEGTEAQQNKSGFAIWVSQTGSYFTVAMYAEKMENIEYRLWDMIYRYDRGLIDGKIEVSYPREYAPNDSQLDLDRFKVISDYVDGSPTLKLESDMRIVEEYMDLPDEILAKIRKELEGKYTSEQNERNIIAPLEAQAVKDLEQMEQQATDEAVEAINTTNKAVQGVNNG